MNLNCCQSQRSQSGVSLVEVLISTSIGLFLVAGSLSLYANIRRIESQANVQLHIQESATFALDIISHDLRMANFWGLHNDPRHLVTGNSGVIYCRNNDVTAWAVQLIQAIELNGSLAPCMNNPDSIDGADRLTLRHASAAPAAPDPRYVQIHTDHRWGYLHKNSAPDTTGMHNPENFQLLIHSYYLSNNSPTGLPELRRWALGSNATMRNEMVMQGISEFEVSFAYLRTGSLVWKNTIDGHPLLARVTLTALSAHGTETLEHKASRIIALKNLPASEPPDAPLGSDSNSSGSTPPT